MTSQFYTIDCHTIMGDSDNSTCYCTICNGDYKESNKLVHIILTLIATLKMCGLDTLKHIHG